VDPSAAGTGWPRLTQDIDALAIMPEAEWAAVIESASRYGIVPHIGGALEFAHRSRVLLLRHSSSGIDVDVTLGGNQRRTPLTARECIKVARLMSTDVR
jgi:hypothetical protein